MSYTIRKVSDTWKAQTEKAGFGKVKSKNK